MAVGTTNYPTSLDTKVELVEAANSASSTLNGSLNSGVTASMTVTDGTSFADSGIVRIDNEYIAYGSKSGNVLSTLVRGLEGSSDATHSNGATVRQVISALSHKVHSDAIIALETKLGTGTDIAWSKMAALTASRVAVTDSTGDIAVSPITHDGTNVIIGNVGAIDFDDSPTATAGASSLARLTWNDTEGTLNLTLKGSNVTVPLSQRDTVRVVNTTANSMSGSNYQVVRITTPQGQRLGVTLAQANTEANSTDIIGFVSETIAANGTGFVTTRGIISGINTTGSLQGETWSEGDVLYLSPSTAGQVTHTKPVAPDNLCIIGYVVYKHATEGKIFVSIQTGWEIDELHNVKVTGAPVAGSLLIYNDTSDIWENATLTAGTNVTVTNADKSITIAAAGDVTGPASSTDAVIARFSGTSGKVIQGSLISINAQGALSFPNDVRQTFSPGANASGLNVGSRSGDPSSLNNGDIWYNSATTGTGNKQFRIRRNGVSETLATVPPTATSNREIPTINPATGSLDNVQEMFYINTTNAIRVGDVATGNLELNAIATETPAISAIGADTNINLNLVSKGTGTVQVNGVNVVTTSGSQTLTNKTLTTPSIGSGGFTLSGSSSGSITVQAAATASGTITIPAGGGTLATTGNKLSAFAATTSSELAGVISDETGSGSLVFATSPTLVTPTLGTPASGTLSNCTVDGTVSVGFMSIPQNSRSADYTAVLGDAGKHIYHPSSDTTPRTYTIPANSSVAYPTGTAITFVNDSTGAITIAITSDTLVFAPGTGTGSRTLAQGGIATAIKIGSTRWIISGVGLT